MRQQPTRAEVLGFAERWGHRDIIRIMKPQYLAVETLGCRVNQYDSDNLADELGRFGVQPAESGIDPDIVVINTCSVTQKSDKKSRQSIRRAARNNPDALVVVTGCFADLEAEWIKALDGVDIVVGSQSSSDLPGLISEVLDLERIGSRSTRPLAVRSHLKVHEGCDEYCSYCVVPFARGEPRSMPLARIMMDAERFIDSGTRELVLTGTHLGKYGADHGDSLVQLVGELFGRFDEERLSRIRLSSLEQGEISRGLLEMMRSENRLCRYLHIPLQSGSTSVLQRMGRHYSGDEYVDSAKALAAEVPGVMLAADVIVGFPGETDEDFAQTVEVVKAAGLSRLHIFKFSARAPAAAAKMSGQLPQEVISARSGMLSEIDMSLRKSHYQSAVGRSLRVLVEEHDREAGVASGLTDDYLRCEFPLNVGDLGETVDFQATTVGQGRGPERVLR